MHLNLLRSIVKIMTTNKFSLNTSLRNFITNMIEVLFGIESFGSGWKLAQVTCSSRCLRPCTKLALTIQNLQSSFSDVSVLNVRQLRISICKRNTRFRFPSVTKPRVIDYLLRFFLIIESCSTWLPLLVFNKPTQSCRRFNSLTFKAFLKALRC